MGRTSDTRSSGLSLLILAIAALMMVGATAPVNADITPEELEQAEAELVVLRGEMQELVDAFEEAVGANERLDAEVAALELSAQRLDEQRVSKQQAVRDRAGAMYIEGMTSRIDLLTLSVDLGAVEAGLEYLENLAVDDQGLVRELDALTGQVERNQVVLESKQVEQAAALAELETVTAELNSRLEEAQAKYNEVYEQYQIEEAARRAAAAAAAAEEEARRRAAEEAAGGGDSGSDDSGGGAPPPVAVSGRTCPVNGVTVFSDTWGAPRSGGRSHQGVDMLSARGTALVAIESGTIKRKSTSSLGGVTVWVRGNSGDEFYYAHLDSWASGLTKGQSVSVGEFIGTVGTSGNAPANVPHLHFEYHPGGGSAVNPTPLVRSLCG